MCQDEALVAKFTDKSHTPTDSEMSDLEKCFQDGILKPAKPQPVHPDCVGTGWGCETANSTWFSCGPKDSGRCMSKGVGSCHTHENDGSILRDEVVLPPNFVSNHTLLGFRWDCEDTGQLWLHCADVKVV